MTPPPDWRERCDITVKVDRLTLGAIFLACSVVLFVWVRSGRRDG